MSEGKWEEFARDDAEFYIYSVDADFSSPEGREMFFASGRTDAAKILGETREVLKGDGLAIEIGCGVGRLAIPMSSHFSRLIAVDVAPTMLHKLASNASEAGVDNIEPMLPDDGWADRSEADLVYSYIVFQHIEDFAHIDRYIAKTASALVPGGVAYLQFDTRPRDLLYALRPLIPDSLLPRTSRRGIRRVRRDPEVLRRLFAAKGLAVISELRAGTADHAFILKKNPS